MADDTSPAPTAWLLITLPPDERQHGGNSGYADDAKRYYRWDSFVPNWKNIREGDIAVLRSDELIGLARFVRIEELTGTRDFRRCPKCNATAIKRRTTISPPYRCSDCHNEFEEPVVETVPARTFTGYFDGTFVAAPAALALPLLTASCPAYNAQLAMQRIDLSGLWPALLAKHPSVASVARGRAEAQVAEESEAADAQGAFDPNAEEDARQRELGAIALRRGQGKFRKALLAAYRGRCAISGCDVEAALEAAHIIPYRGEHTNHVQNGILLRADIHTLFDLRLLTIDADSGVVVIAPALAGTTYGELNGRLCSLPEAAADRPSRDALARQREGCGF